MSLPPNCKRVSLEERTIAAKSHIQDEHAEPFFAIYDDIFLNVLGADPKITLAIEKDYPFAHEAGVYFPDQDAVYITSARLGGREKPHVKIAKVSRQQDGSWKDEELPTDVVLGNGGINYQSGVLFCSQGSKTAPGGLVLMEAQPPYATKTLIDSYQGRLFNSVNDVIIHTDGSIWFTDPIYGFEQGFKNKPQLPRQVYRFDPETGDTRVVADGFGRPNGLCFSPDEQTMYITDTDFMHGDGSIDPLRPATVYAFDIIKRHGADFLANRRVFAMCDNGIPDGIKCDLQGNVYSGCGDGVHVWSPNGSLIGKIVVPGDVANFCFTKKGEMILLNEERLYEVKINGNRQGALLKNMGIEV